MGFMYWDEGSCFFLGLYGFFGVLGRLNIWLFIIILEMLLINVGLM